VNYQKGRCTTQPIGINKIGKFPMRIAQYLGLPNPHEYTGHSFRTTAATLIVQAGASLLQLKQVGGWLSNANAEGYVQNDDSNRISTAERIMSNIHLPTIEVSVSNYNSDEPGTSNSVTQSITEVSMLSNSSITTMKTQNMSIEKLTNNIIPKNNVISNNVIPNNVIPNITFSR